MHDPDTVAFEIKYPWKAFRNPKNDFERRYRDTFITIWHHDPETDGTDDSCGWFMRVRHGDKKIFEKIVKQFEFEWDSIFKPEAADHIYYTGWFKPNGDLNMTLQGVTLDMFYRAAGIVFNYNWKKVDSYIQNNLAHILHFADNPIDSANRGFLRVFEKGCGEEYTEQARKEWIRNTASMIYTFILRDIRPWYKHPRWHIHHWRIQFNFIQDWKNRWRKMLGKTDNDVAKVAI